MKRKIIFSLFFILLISLLSFFSGYAENAVMPTAYEGKIISCGDAFTIEMIDGSYLTNFLKRNSSWGGPIPEMTIRPVNTLFVTRFRIRNISQYTLEGLKPESFVLSGVLEDRKKDYTPAIIQDPNFKTSDWHDLVGEYTQGTMSGLDFRNAIKNLTFTQSDLFVSQDEHYKMSGYEVGTWARPARIAALSLLPLRSWDLIIAFDVKDYLTGWTFTFNPQPGIEGTDFPGCSVTFKIPYAYDELHYKLINY